MVGSSAIMDGPQATGNLEAQVSSGAGFGRPMLEHWALDPDVVYLNHGTVGVTPRSVLAEQQRLRDEIERRPSQFLLRELTAITVGVETPNKPLMRVAADQVAEFFGARGDDLVFVDNTTTGVNAVLRSFDWQPGEEMVLTDLGYGAIGNAARHVGRERGVAVRIVETPYPPTPEAMVSAVVDALGPNTRLAVVDHITSESALVMPLSRIAEACHARGVAVVADGAHAPGAIALDLPSQGVDWYVGNLHKWAFAPRSCGILWARPERQGIHPTVISWGLDQGFTAEFDLVGTRDPTAHLAAPAGIAFMRDLGLQEMWEHNHGLAWRGARMLAQRWGTSFDVPETMVGTMATVPLPESAGSTRPEAVNLRGALLMEDRIEVQLHAWRGRLWARISCQVYNDMNDIERLANAVTARV
jgi:isopenicillin-N epimerase